MRQEGIIICVLLLIRSRLIVCWPESLISYGPPIPYDFGYNVYVPETGDYHGHQQSQDIRGYTSGSYYLLAPDGAWHETTFSDSGSGYNAIMKKRHKDDPPDYVRQDKALSMYFNLGNKNTLFLDSNIGVPVVDQTNFEPEYPQLPSYLSHSDHPLLPAHPLHHFTFDGSSGPSAPHNKLMISRTPIPVSTNVYLRPTSHNNVQFPGQFKRMASNDFVPSKRPGSRNNVRNHLTPPPPPHPHPPPSPPHPSPYPIFEASPFKLDFGPFSKDNEKWKIGDMIDNDNDRHERDKIRITKDFRKGFFHPEELLPELLKIERPKTIKTTSTTERITTTRNIYEQEAITEPPLAPSKLIENNPITVRSAPKTLIEQFRYRPIRQEGVSNEDALQINNNDKFTTTFATLTSNEIITLDNIHKYRDDYQHPIRHSNNAITQNTQNNAIRNEEKNKEQIKLGEDVHFRPIIFNDKKKITHFDAPKINDNKNVQIISSTASTLKAQDSLLRNHDKKDPLTTRKPFESKKIPDSENKFTPNPTSPPVVDLSNKFTHFKAVQKESIDEIIAALRKKKLEENKKPASSDSNNQVKQNNNPPRPLFVRPKVSITDQTSNKEDSFKHNIPNAPQIDFDKLKKPGEVINKVKYIQLHGLAENILPNLPNLRRPAPKPAPKSPSRIVLSRDHSLFELLQKLSKERPDLVSTKPISPSDPKPSMPKEVIQTIKQQLSLQSLAGADSISSESSSQVSNIASPFSLETISSESENISSDDVIPPLNESKKKYDNNLGDFNDNKHDIISIPVNSELGIEAREVIVIPLGVKKKHRGTKIAKGSLNAVKTLKPMLMNQYKFTTSQNKFKPSKAVNVVRGYVATAGPDNSYSASIQEEIRVDPRNKFSFIETIEIPSEKVNKKSSGKRKTVIKKATDLTSMRGLPYTPIEDDRDYKDPMEDSAFGESKHYWAREELPSDPDEDDDYAVINAARFFLALPPP